MWSVSQQFSDTVTASHEIVTRCDVLDNGAVIRSGIAVSAGTITRDRRAGQYGRVTGLVVNEPDLVPTTPASELGPAGFEVQLWRGVRFPNGDEELVPLGIFPIQDAAVDDESLSTTIEGIDRSQRISDAKLETDRTYAAGTFLGLQLVVLCLEVIPGLLFDVDGATGDEASPLVAFPAQSDRWTDIVMKVSQARGWEAYFDGVGKFILRDEPSLLTSEPVAEISEGESGVLLTASLAWTRRHSFNRAIVTGSNAAATATFRGVATDNDPASPSYYFGRFGPKPYFVNSPLVTSNASAAKAAKAILVAKQGVAKSLSFGAIPNPAIEPGDVVTVRRARLTLDEPVIVDTITIGLGPEDSMSCEVRSRQEEEIES